MATWEVPVSIICNTDVYVQADSPEEAVAKVEATAGDLRALRRLVAASGDLGPYADVIQVMGPAERGLD